MDRKTELALIDELLSLKKANSAFLDENVAQYPVENYTSNERLELERQKLFRTLPTIAAHVSELSENGSFLTQSINGKSLLITRDKDGGIHAFLNACRHRGSQLVEEGSGCRNKFSCPYHAWTYSNSGELLAAPHFEEGFPGLDKSTLSLRRVNCEERFGFIWVWGQGESERDTNLGSYFDGLAEDLDGLGISAMKIAAATVTRHKVNWKILVEGGIEAYHFRVAHRRTIGPHFEDNLSTYRCFGSHMRSVLPRKSMASLAGEARETWRLRDHANVLYTLFPANQLLVMQDHIMWIRLEPIAAGETEIRLATLAPISGADAAGKDDEHWKRNHDITTTTLDEDFAIGVGIQSNAMSGAMSQVLFGRFEGALDQLNRTIEGHLFD